MTNKIKINYENVNSKYHIIMLKIPFNKDKSIFENVNKLIDSIDLSKVFAVYRKGRGFILYILIDKTYKINLSEIFNIDLYQMMIEKYSMQVIYDCKLDNDSLLNLLLVGIKNAINNETLLNNLDGKLYEMIYTKGNQVVALLYSINDGCLNADVVTFEECYNKIGKRTFTINKNYMKVDNTQDSVFIIRNQKDKNKVSFFNAEKYSSFQETKLYKLNEIIRLFNKIYEGICNIEFEHIDMYEKKFTSISAKNRFYRDKSQNIVMEIGLNIIDNINNEEVIDLIELALNRKSINYTKSEELEYDKFNLNVIHNKTNSDKDSDKYLKSNTIVVQNITYEDALLKRGKIIDWKQFNNILDVILSEMVHKYEMNNKKIIQYNTNNRFLEKYIFGEIKKINEHYYRFELALNNDNMSFMDEHLSEKNQNKEMLYIKDKETNEVIEIEVMRQYPIVNTNELNKDYYSCYCNVVSSRDLADKIITLKNKRKKYDNVYDEFIYYINNHPDDTMANLREDVKRNLFPIENYIRKYGDALKYLNIDLYDKYGVFFNPLWRRAGSPYKNTFTNFKFKYDSNNGLIYYSANCSSPKQEMPNGLPFRRIKTKFSEEEINDYLMMLDVDNIRNGQNTVIPYPFKYLREYINYYIKCLKSETE